MDKVYELDEGHCRQFIRDCEEFQDKFNLGHYDLTFTFEDDLEGGVQAQFWAPQDDTQFVATIALSRRFVGVEPTPEVIRSAAFHEMCHVLFWSMYMYAQDNDLSKSNKAFLLTREQHRIINVLSRLLT